MAMRTPDMHEIVKGTVEHFRVRCDHRRVPLDDNDLKDLSNFLCTLLEGYVDNSADTGGEWDNG